MTSMITAFMLLIKNHFSSFVGSLKAWSVHSRGVRTTNVWQLGQRRRRVWRRSSTTVRAVTAFWVPGTGVTTKAKV